MAKLPLYIPTYPGHEISNCHWDEEYQLYRVTVDGEEYVSTQPPERLKGFAQSNRRRAAAFEAMARCAEARENRLKAEDEDLSRIRSEVMAEAGYFGQGYRAGVPEPGANYPTAQRLVDLAVEARENREKSEEARRDRTRAEVMREARYFLTDEEGYQNLGRNNPHVRRLVDIAVEARLKLEERV